jgi:uncharacterized protein (TIGR03086 family)
VVELATGKTIDEVGGLLEGDVLGDDPVEVFQDSADAACDAFAEPGAMSRTFHLSFGDAPGSLYVSQRFVEVLIHSWDVAVATGQVAGLDDELVRRCFDIVEPRQEAMRGSGLFGSEVPVDDDAATQVRLLAMLGRRA